MAGTRTAAAQRAFGVAIAVAACWPVWRGIDVLGERDYVGCALALVMAWLLARSGIELVESADRLETQRGPGGARPAAPGGEP